MRGGTPRNAALSWGLLRQHPSPRISAAFLGGSLRGNIMPTEGKRWRHVVISTLNSRLPGDPRGFAPSITRFIRPAITRTRRLQENTRDCIVTAKASAASGSSFPRSFAKKSAP